MATLGWLVLIVGGPILLGLAIVIGMSRSRRLSPSEQAAQEQKVKELYNENEP